MHIGDPWYANSLNILFVVAKLCKLLRSVQDLITKTFNMRISSEREYHIIHILLTEKSALTSDMDSLIRYLWSYSVV